MSRKSDAFLEKLDIDGQDQLSIKCHKMFAWHLSRLLKEIEREARLIVRTNHPGGTGNLASSIHSDGITHRTSRHVWGTVSAGSSKAPYAKFVHNGTKGHIRTAQPGKGYAFMWAGRESKRSYNLGSQGIRPIRLKDKGVYVKRVKVKRRKADPFLRTATDAVMARRRGG